MTNSTEIQGQGLEYELRRAAMLQLIVACEQSHPASSVLLKGILLQLDWQWSSGRWGLATGKGDGWWELANRTLTTWVTSIASQQGVIKSRPIGTDRMSEIPRAVRNAWSTYFDALQSGESSKSNLDRLYWTAHEACLDEISAHYNDELVKLPNREQSFAKAWIRLVRVLVAIRFSPKFSSLKKLQGLLPSQVLDDEGWKCCGARGRWFIRALVWSTAWLAANRSTEVITLQVG